MNALDPVDHVRNVCHRALVTDFDYPDRWRPVIARAVLAYYEQGTPLEESFEGVDDPAPLEKTGRDIVATVDAVIASAPNLRPDCLAVVGDWTDTRLI